MQISGINTLTLIDFPGKTACVVFTPGCNFRCGFCHNAEYVLPEKIAEIQDTFIPEEALFNFLKTRKGLIEGVVITGGEPTLQTDLIDFIRQIKQKNLFVKLDTNGTNPKILEQLFQENLIDFVAMDLKTTFEKYAELVAMPINIEKIKKSLQLILNSKIDSEFRTTIFKEHHTSEVFSEMQKVLKGAQTFALQNFQNTSVLNPVYKDYTAFSEAELEEIAESFRKVIPKVLLRK